MARAIDPTLTDESVTLGVVGGGQLGRMMAEAAAPLGVELVVADPTPDCPASAVAADQLVGGFDDPETILQLAKRADLLTFEIELTDPDVLEDVSKRTGTPVEPAPRTLRMIQDKLTQNRRLEEAGIPIPAFEQVDDQGDLEAAIDRFDYPVMLKAREGGYDGRGNFLIEKENDIEPALEAAPGRMLVEQIVEFDRELSVIGVKGDGERAAFPAGENIHREEILRQTVVPARTDDVVLERAQAVAEDVLDLMDGRGVYGIELFEENGDILVNEIAPRPHNSGHYTIEGAQTSQFEQHVRAVLGWPLGSTELREPVAMSNILADTETARPARLTGVDDVLEMPGANLHWYGKREARPLRKMGHVTVIPTEETGATRADLLATARDCTEQLTFTSHVTPTRNEER
ncbi:MAG: 5-(carboxyamino)imidazole ribonucleotide synthase [Halobacteriales archaeon]|nr:5-(carboxyamino)imidazole ribonucleotide synthase [Halobacteriales archaeon]